MNCDSSESGPELEKRWPNMRLILSDTKENDMVS